jgi:hypothetical protein
MCQLSKHTHALGGSSSETVGVLGSVRCCTVRYGRYCSAKVSYDSVMCYVDCVKLPSSCMFHIDVGGQCDMIDILTPMCHDGARRKRSKIFFFN